MKKYVGVHLAKAYTKTAKGKSFSHFLSWGDDVEQTGTEDEFAVLSLKVRATEKDGGVIYEPGTYYVKSSALVDQTKVLKVNFVDVQQGDATVLETPDHQVVLIDGGDNKLFARYLAARFRKHDQDEPFIPEAIVVTHGDADHFEGLAEISKSIDHDLKRKHLYLWPKRVFHNGLVKRPKKINDKNTKETEFLGNTEKVQGRRNPVIVDLLDDVRDCPEEQRNQPFDQWVKALNLWDTYRPANSQPNKTTHKRLAFGSDVDFDFLTDELKKHQPGSEVNVLGPITIDANGKPGLPFLGKPKKGIENQGKRTGNSASHTINGHSIVLRVKYGNVRFLLTGDLNEEAEEVLLHDPNTRPLLEADVFKAPHHGSADFLPGFLDAVSPVISVISSGDENVRKEYIHPRANLVASLSRTSRTPQPVVFCTELAAFFKMEGDSINLKTKKWFFGFSRAAFGMVRVRTDGDVVVVTTDSAKLDMREAYAYRIDGQGNAQPIDVEII